MLIRNLQLDKEHGRKLEARWFPPRVVERVSSSGVSVWVREIHSPPSGASLKRYHIDDVLVVKSRKHVPSGDGLEALPRAPSVWYSPSAREAEFGLMADSRTADLRV